MIIEVCKNCKSKKENHQLSCISPEYIQIDVCPDCENGIDAKQIFFCGNCGLNNFTTEEK